MQVATSLATARHLLLAHMASGNILSYQYIRSAVELHEVKRFQSVALTLARRKLVPVLAALADQNDAEIFGHLSTREQEALKDLFGMASAVVSEGGPTGAAATRG